MIDVILPRAAGEERLEAEVVVDLASVESHVGEPLSFREQVGENVPLNISFGGTGVPGGLQVTMQSW